MTDPEYTYTDSDGDTVSLYRTSYHHTAHAWKLHIRPASARKVNLAVWLTHDAAADLAEVLRPAVTTELGASFETVARAEYRFGDLSVIVEGSPDSTPKQVAKALRRLLLDVTSPTDGDLLEQLAEVFDCETESVIEAARNAKAIILNQDQRIGQLVTESETRADVIKQIAQDRDGRPTAYDHRVAVDGWKAARDRIKFLDELLESERNGMAELRKELRQAGLSGMAAKTTAGIVATIKALGDENNDLRNRLSAEGMLSAKATLSRQATEIVELNEALAQAHRELRAARATSRTENELHLRVENDREISLREVADTIIESALDIDNSRAKQ